MRYERITDDPGLPQMIPDTTALSDMVSLQYQDLPSAGAGGHPHSITP
jgi:hypothetical protein